MSKTTKPLFPQGEPLILDADKIVDNLCTTFKALKHPAPFTRYQRAFRRLLTRPSDVGFFLAAWNAGMNNRLDGGSIDDMPRKFLGFTPAHQITAGAWRAGHRGHRFVPWITTLARTVLCS